MAANTASSQRRRKRWLITVLAVSVAMTAGGLGLHEHLHYESLARQLLESYPQDVTRNPALVRFAIAQAKPLFQRDCAVCHGANLRGDPVIGAADLANGHWLWGDGTVFQIERIILYGIRSAYVTKTLNVTDMPAYGLSGRLSSVQIHDLVQYLLKLNHRPYDAGTALVGKSLFYSPTYDCDDCHNTNAQGNPDYGAPNLTVNKWNNGGTEQDLYDSIYFGRYRIMPAWFHILTLEQIRALAVYIHEVSHNAAVQASSAQGASGAPGASG